MTDEPPETPPPPDDDLTLSLTQLRGLQYGVAGTIMPVANGWRIHYFSIPNFEDEPGTDFPSLEEAVVAMAQILAAMNTEEERARAHAELRERLRQSSRDSFGDHPVK